MTQTKAPIPGKNGKIKDRAASYSKTGISLAIKTLVLYAALTITGLFLGAIGGYWIAAHFMMSFWVTVLFAILGLAGGGLCGFFLAPVIILGLAQDMLLEAGLKTGKFGLQTIRKLLK